MKKFIAILSIFLLLSFNMNTIVAIAETKTLTEGFYKIKDTGLTTGIPYNVKNTAPTGRAIVMIFDENALMQEFIRLEANSPAYVLKPLNFDSTLVIVGGGTVTFS
ncbi:hypothetical protein [Clostridium sp.]|uniref:hypothetical protein n=1 Tax=Clostridium sp. TaxID=1506 RepID=UPI002635D757|nr:hypothetical protein [Clostridium sp.]